MNRDASRRRALTAAAAAVVAAASLAIPALAKDVKPKPDGAYLSALGKRGFSGVVLNKGKIGELIVNAKYKKAGKVCRAQGNGSSDLSYINFRVKKPRKPKASGKFSAKGRSPAGIYEGATAKVKGRFKSSTKASFKISAKWNGCKTGTIRVKKATYRSGG